MQIFLGDFFLGDKKKEAPKRSFLITEADD
jgi:hypothetical protein